MVFTGVEIINQGYGFDICGLGVSVGMLTGVDDWGYGWDQNCKVSCRKVHKGVLNTN